MQAEAGNEREVGRLKEQLAALSEEYERMETLGEGRSDNEANEALEVDLQVGKHHIDHFLGSTCLDKYGQGPLKAFYAYCWQILPALFRWLRHSHVSSTFEQKRPTSQF